MTSMSRSTRTTTNTHLVNASVEPRYISLFTPYSPATLAWLSSNMYNGKSDLSLV